VDSWLTVLLWTCLGFLSGSIPFSVWLGRIFLRSDIRRFGDGNPGAASVVRSGSRVLGLAVMMLDISKAAAPVGLAYFNAGWRGWPMLLIAVSPMLGHAFSPFLGFRGGKALACALGTWIGLTLWRIALPAVILVGFLGLLLDNSGWIVVLTLAGLLAVLLIWAPDPLLLGVLAGQFVLLVWTHRHDLRRPPRPRPWLNRLQRHRS
jgi:glycerol-3-phosphate acyltransferase PlsY